MSSLRLFIALETPPEITPLISTIRDRLKTCQADVKWEPDEKLHATIKFLGETPDRLLPEIVSSIARIAGRYAPLIVRYRRIGCFPNLRDPKVVWVGLEETSGQLEAMQMATEEAMQPMGFERERRRFHPHVTLGRVKGRKALHGLLTMMESVTFESPQAIIEHLSLVRSELKPGGSVYTTLKHIPLRARNQGNPESTQPHTTTSGI